MHHRRRRQPRVATRSHRNKKAINDMKVDAGAPIHLVLEGTHGVGKTTAMTRADITATRIPSLLVPFDVLNGLPGDPRAVYHVNDVAKCAVRAIDESRSTVMDRTFTSSLAFAAFASEAHGDVAFLGRTRRRVEESLRRGTLSKPDVVVVFDLDPSVAWQRVVSRDNGHWTTEAEIWFLRQFHLSPPSWYLELLGCEYLVHQSGTLEENSNRVASVLRSGV